MVFNLQQILVIILTMIFLHRLSGFFFFLLGLSLFSAYVFFRNELLGGWPLWWLQVTDLPLLLTAVFYGGTGFYLNLKKPDKSSPVLGGLIFIVLMAAFSFFALLNFWDVLPPEIKNLLVN